MDTAGSLSLLVTWGGIVGWWAGRIGGDPLLSQRFAVAGVIGFGVLIAAIGGRR